jgi:four helix bundle protein
MKENVIKDKSYHFALSIIAVVRMMPKTTDGYVIAKQLMRSGTSIGANVEEAIAAFSRDDFIFKMNTAWKEARETQYWLRLIRDSNMIPQQKVEPLIQEAEEIKKILSAIVKTSKERNV